jgi:hypothetical protein
MGYDILLYCMKTSENDPAFYHEIEGAPHYSSRAYRVQPLFGLGGITPDILPKVWCEWLESGIPPEGMLDEDEVYLTQGHITQEFLFDARAILESVITLETFILEHIDLLPKWYSFDIQNTDTENHPYSEYARSFWAVLDGETWFFTSGWDMCLAYPKEVPLRPTYPGPIPLERWDLTKKSGILKLEGYVFPNYFSELQGKSVALGRYQNNLPKDKIEIKVEDYYQFYQSFFVQIKSVCTYAIEHNAPIFVLHSV